ncbi:Permease of the drug/metabolite transporter (DMT) superfamily [Halanaeroarchaeum sp. HSR-CO]|nr:Permease of the drug/metabolite transporter (DMT) superfamily [Halanaeroarchaeum sp. HSR-CO]
MYVVSKWGFASIPPATLAFLRVALGAATLVLVVRLQGQSRTFSFAEHRRFALLGIWVAITLLTQFVGTDLTNASQGSLLTVLTPVFTLLLGILVLEEGVTVRKVGGMAIATVGTVVVLAGQYDLTRLGEGSAIGISALLLASFGWAAYTVWGTPLVRRYSALETATYSTVWAVPLLFVVAVAELWTLGRSPLTLPTTAPVLAAVFYLGVLSTAAAWYLWYRGVESLEAGVVAVFFFAQPVVGVLLGTVILEESLGPTFIAGGLVMAVGIYVVSTAGRAT